MPTLPLYQIDAFTNTPFTGNPAAVCPLDAWLDDATLQAIAEENNLAETAFFIPTGDTTYDLRWFTPRFEVPLCGHATLATAHLLFNTLKAPGHVLHFDSQSGPLRVAREEALLTMDFPALRMQECPDPPRLLAEGLGIPIEEVYRVEEDTNYFVVLEEEAAVRRNTPRLSLLEQLHPYGVVVTAPGTQSDCASRYFAPSYGIPEDPVTGSIHCALIPFWAERLGTTRIHARQVSPRGGTLYCEDRGDRVALGGQAVTYLSGEIYV